MPTAIEFNHISKQYRLGLVSTRTLSHDLNRWWTMNILRKEDPYLKIGETNDRSTKGNSEYVWALRDIDFKIEQGDVVGIIGKNGAGKSTLLKLLSRVTAPTTGTIRAKGRIASLLEVGTGFHPEMTGRENIFMNGAIMGMTKQEIRAKLVGFAVAAHLDPEILVVDEVLAVGDAEFQKKAIGKMQDVSRGDGRTVLFVSHNMASMQRLCSRGVLLEYGSVKFIGSISDTINKYMSSQVTQQTFNNGEGDKDVLWVEYAKVYPENGNVFYNTQNIYVQFKVNVAKKIPSLVIGFNLYSAYQYPLARTDYNDYNGLHSLDVGEYEFVFKIPADTLSNGEYKIVFDIAEKGVKNYASENSVLTFQVEHDNLCVGNVFAENIPIKASIIRENWLVGIKKL